MRVMTWLSAVLLFAIACNKTPRASIDPFSTHPAPLTGSQQRPEWVQPFKSS